MAGLCLTIYPRPRPIPGHRLFQNRTLPTHLPEPLAIHAMRQTSHLSAPHLHIRRVLGGHIRIIILAKLGDGLASHHARPAIKSGNHGALDDQARIRPDGVGAELAHVDGPEVVLEERLHPRDGDRHDVLLGAGAEGAAAAGQQLAAQSEALFLRHDHVVGPVLHRRHHVGALGQARGEAPYAAAADLVVSICSSVGGAAVQM